MRKRLLAVLALTAAAACGAPGGGPGSAAPPSESPTGTATTAVTAPPSATATATTGLHPDFDGDGHADLVLTDTSATVNGKYAAGYVAVVYGSAAGPDVRRHQVITQDSLGLGKAGTGGGFGRDTVTADLDGDGRSDLITQAGGSTVFVVWGGTKELSGAVELTGAAPLVGDFDGDGHADLVTTGGTTGGTDGQATIRFGPFTRAGKPARTTTLDLTPDNPSYYTARPTAIGDVNGDGKDDVVVTWSHVFADEAPTPRATVVYLGAADGVLKKGPRLKDANGKDLYGASTLTSDVNHDGYADVIVGLTCESIGDETTPEGGSRLMVAYGGQSGQSGQSAGLKPTVISAKTPGLPGAPDPSRCDFGYAPATGDVNGDGYTDVALAVPAKDGTMVALVLRGGPKGLTVENAMSVPGLSTRPTLAIQDLNGDGAAELAIGTSYASAADDAVRVLRSGPAGLSTAAPTRIGPADLGLKPAPGDSLDFGH